MRLKALKAAEGDDVAVALEPLAAGATALDVVLSEDIPAGHKFAVRTLRAGERVCKLGHAIGIAGANIAAGELVHTHNLVFAAHDGVSQDCKDVRHPAPYISSFQGFHRADGRVGTRNHVGILTSVNCSATVARRIAARFPEARLAAFANVDGVVALTHSSGCGMASKGPGIDNLRRTIAGYAAHPNFGGVLVVGLGCEVNQIDALLAAHGLEPSDRLRTLEIQDAGGTQAAIDEGERIVEDLLRIANADRRALADASALTIGLQCGASDGFSALTANPALGIAADMIVGAGGRIVLSETPEIYGAEDLLLRRAASPAIANALRERLSWWEAYAARDGASLDNNPSPGNKAGGITTILEKSLGAVAKAGSSPLNDVVSYAAPIKAAGLTFMDTPGYDPCSATGQIAGGANLIVFTTGRGSVFGSVPTPTLKLASNSQLAQRMPDDIDIDCGVVLDGADLKTTGAAVFDAIIAAASGKTTRSEAAGLGENEWVPWIVGATY